MPASANTLGTHVDACKSSLQSHPVVSALLLRVSQVMLHRLGQRQAADQCVLQEDNPECFLELATTSDGAYITINSNAKTASEVGSWVVRSTKLVTQHGGVSVKFRVCLDAAGQQISDAIACTLACNCNRSSWP